MAKSRGYQERFYRDWVKSKDLITQEIIVGETDLCISAEKDIKEIAEKIVRKYREEIDDYIKGRKSQLTVHRENKTCSVQSAS